MIRPRCSGNRLSRTSLALLAAVFFATLLSSCDIRLSPTPTPTITPTATLIPTPTRPPTPTPPPLGTPGNPIIIGFVSEAADPVAIQSGEASADRLTQLAGYEIRALAFADYDSLLNEMDDRHVHIAWLPPFTYLIARNRGFADAGLVANHFGTYSYGFSIMANPESQFTTYFDPLINQPTGPADLALTQLQERKPCWVDQTSASGYVAPLGLLAQLGLTLQEPVFTTSHSATVRALYIKGICDFGATYATIGDPRTGDSLLVDLPDVMDHVVILWQSDAVIPNTNVTFHTELPADMRQRITDALLEYIRTPEGKSTLTTALNYDVEAFKIIDDRYYDNLRSFQGASGIFLRTLLGK
jgi:phosphonate transport system substrate-binding protein